MHDLLLENFRIALSAADPFMILPKYLPAPPVERTLVIGGGKASAAMAKAVEEAWPMSAPLSGLVVTRYQHSLPTSRIKVIEASHPLPDGRGADAAKHMIFEAQQLGPDDLLLVLLSGGGSSLLALPMDGLTLQDLRAVTKALLASGAPIHEINTVRKHLTDFSGGKVAALSTAPVAALIISDVVGNNPSHIASGPCAPDESTYSDAASILARYAIDPPNVVKVHLERGMRGDIAENPKPGDPLFNKVINRIVTNAGDALSRVEAHLGQAGISVINLGEAEGDSRTIAEQHAALVREKLLRTRRPFALLSGGETTVALRNMPGRGGRNTEYLLALGLALEGIEEVWAIACDTDGIDGTENNAGAIWTPDTLSRARTLNIDATSQLDRNDAYGFFSALNDLVVTGPTRTNVNDFRLVILN